MINRKNVIDILKALIGDIVAVKAGEGNDFFIYIILHIHHSLKEIIQTNYKIAIITLTSKNIIIMNMPKTVISNDLTINGIVTWANIGVKSPILF